MSKHRPRPGVNSSPRWATHLEPEMGCAEAGLILALTVIGGAMIIAILWEMLTRGIGL